MQYQQIDPDLPSLARWISLNKRYPRQSTLRMMEYEALENLPLEGKVLDLGGGENSHYRKTLTKDIDYYSANIDPKINPTWLVEPGKPLPIEDNSFDTCISLNTLEHVYDPSFLISEIHRILKPGGVVHITVPWIFRIHGHPDDFTRATPSWWRKTLEMHQFCEASVLPLVWGRYSTGSSITGIRMPFKMFFNTIVHIKDIIYAAVAIRGTNGKYAGKRGQRICNIAPGHLISAVKYDA